MPSQPGRAGAPRAAYPSVLGGRSSATYVAGHSGRGRGRPARLHGPRRRTDHHRDGEYVDDGAGHSGPSTRLMVGVCMACLATVAVVVFLLGAVLSTIGRASTSTTVSHSAGIPSVQKGITHSEPAAATAPPPPADPGLPDVAAPANMDVAPFTTCRFGLDSMGRIDDLPLYRPLYQSRAMTGYNREGYDGDAHGYLYVQSNRLVMMDEYGAGVITSLWLAGRRNSRPGWTIHFELDEYTISVAMLEVCSGAREPFMLPFIGEGRSLDRGCYAFISLPFKQRARVYLTGDAATSIAETSNYYEVMYTLVPELPPCVANAHAQLVRFGDASARYKAVRAHVARGIPVVAPTRALQGNQTGGARKPAASASTGVANDANKELKGLITEEGPVVNAPTQVGERRLLWASSSAGYAAARDDKRRDTAGARDGSSARSQAQGTDSGDTNATGTGGVIRRFELAWTGADVDVIAGLEVEAYWDGGDVTPNNGGGDGGGGGTTTTTTAGSTAGSTTGSTNTFTSSKRTPQLRVPAHYLFFGDPLADAKNVATWLVWRAGQSRADGSSQSTGRLLAPMPFASKAEIYLVRTAPLPQEAVDTRPPIFQAVVSVAPPYPAGVDWLPLRATFHTSLGPEGDAMGNVPQGKPMTLLSEPHAAGHIAAFMFNVYQRDKRARVQPMTEAGIPVSPYAYEGDPHIRVDGSRSTTYEGSGHEDIMLDAHGFQLGTSEVRGSTTFSVKEEAGDITVYYQAYRVLPTQTPWAFRAGVDFSIDHGDGHPWNGVRTLNSAVAAMFSVVLWYGRLGQPGLVETDVLRPAAPEARHAYAAGDDAVAITTTGQFESGSSGDQDVHSYSGFSTPTGSSFTVRIRPDNRGVVLRRVLDYGYANQRARVLVDDVTVGVWYTAGMNRFFELKESDFMVPPAHVQGKDEIRVRLQNLDEVNAANANAKQEWFAEFTNASDAFRAATGLRVAPPSYAMTWTELEWRVLVVV